MKLPNWVSKLGVRVFFLLLAIGTFGCASNSYKRVLVSVVDSDTHKPVVGATF
jgi:hypothetical protein